MAAEPTAGGLFLVPKMFDRPDSRLPRYFVSHDELRGRRCSVSNREFKPRASSQPDGATTVPSSGRPPSLLDSLPMLAIRSVDPSKQELFDNIQVLDIKDTAYSDRRRFHANCEALLAGYSPVGALKLQNL